MLQRLTRPTRVILEFLLDRSRANEATWGFEIASKTDLKGGTVYPVLSRLSEEGWIESYWEDNVDARRGPRRRMYQLTSAGAAQAVQLLDARPALAKGEPSWLPS
jgi:DNA-binding PadR family transcriptional regulator